METDKTGSNPAKKEEASWGNIPSDHYGYASDTERREQRGLEDWEMVENIPTGQKRVPKWFIAGAIVIFIVAIGLSLPFWGDRPGHERPWLTMGHLFAFFYVTGAFVLIYFMTRLYGSGKSSDEQTDFEDDIDMPGHSNRRDKQPNSQDEQAKKPEHTQ